MSTGIWLRKQRKKGSVILQMESVWNSTVNPDLVRINLKNKNYADTLSWSSKHIWNTSRNERQLQCTSSDWDYKAKWALCAQRRSKSYRAQPNRCFLLILCPCGCTCTCLPMSAVQCVEVCEHLCLWVYSSLTIIIWIYKKWSCTYLYDRPTCQTQSAVSEFTISPIHWILEHNRGTERLCL